MPPQILQKRIQKEIMDLERDPPPGITCYPKEDNITELEAYIKGPPDSPYEKGLFKLSIQVPDRYPFEPPQIKFITSIYHPNIDDTGRICADILKTGEHGSWKPAINLSTALISLRQLLATPNPDDPLDADIAKEYQLNYPSFLQNAKEYTAKFANEETVLNAKDEDTRIMENIVEKIKNDVIDTIKDEAEEEEQEKKPKISLSLLKKKGSNSQSSPLSSQVLKSNNNDMKPKNLLCKKTVNTEKKPNTENDVVEMEKIKQEQEFKEEEESMIKEQLIKEEKTINKAKKENTLDKNKKANKIEKVEKAKKIVKKEKSAGIVKTKETDVAKKVTYPDKMKDIDSVEKKPKINSQVPEPVIIIKQSNIANLSKPLANLSPPINSKLPNKATFTSMYFSPSSSLATRDVTNTELCSDSEGKRSYDFLVDHDIIELSDDDDDLVRDSKKIHHSFQLSKKYKRNKISLSKTKKAV